MPSKLAADVLEFTDVADTLDTPVAVLDALDAITWGACKAHVLGAALLPLNFGTNDSLVVGKTVFPPRPSRRGGGRSGWNWEQDLRLPVT